jgi:hypothetical protein
LTSLATTSSVVSTYSNSLSPISPRFVRPSGNSGNYYYYQAIKVTVHTTGIYTFTSNSSIDTVGCLYNGTFDSVHPSQNLIICQHDDGSGGQFQINRSLLATRLYVLVATTYDPSATGDFSITVVGSTSISLTLFTSTTPWLATAPPTTPKPTTPKSTTPKSTTPKPTTPSPTTPSTTTPKSTTPKPTTPSPTTPSTTTSPPTTPSPTIPSTTTSPPTTPSPTIPSPTIPSPTTPTPTASKRF